MAQTETDQPREGVAVSGRSWRLNLALVPALIMAALPKCPLCLLAYAGVLGTLGLDPWLYRAWFLPLTLAFSTATLVVLAFRAQRRHGYGPFFVGFTAVTVILASKFYFDSMPMLYFGIVLLLAASIWNSWPKKEKPLQLSCHC